MGIKYYELQVKKLVNFAGVSYALTSDVALKLSKSEFNTFKNGIELLGTAAAKDFVEYSAINLGSFETWQEANEGIEEYALGDVVYVGDAGYICTSIDNENFQLNFKSLSSCTTSLKDFVAHASDTNIHITSAERTAWNKAKEDLSGHASDKNIHITSEERTAWNKKVDTDDIVAGNNITVDVDENGVITISGAAEYELPVATEETLGGIKIGDGIEQQLEDDLTQEPDAEGNYPQIFTGKYQAVAKVKEGFTTNTAVGNIAKGTKIEAGTTLDAILTKLLVTYITPSFNSFTSTLGGSVECGSTFDSTVTFDWKWNDYTYTKANITAGTVDIKNTTAGSFIVENISGSGSKESESYTTTEKITLYYTEPVTHKFNIYADHKKGSVTTKEVSKSWAYKYFYGKDAVTSNVDTIIADIRNSKYTNALCPVSKTTAPGKFTINAGAGDKIAWFAYPATMRDVSSVIALDSMNAQVKTAFTQKTFDLLLPDGTTKVTYKFYYLIPDEPYTQTARYDVTI